MWIETDNQLKFVDMINVTSLAEVWIETYNLLSLRFSVLSLPLRKCGLKHIIHKSILPVMLVTSLAEVWIETEAQKNRDWQAQSLPLRKCGLKLLPR